MKTLADLKRDLKVGTAVELVKFNSEIAIPERLQGVRYVVKVKSNGVEFNKDKTATKQILSDLSTTPMTKRQELILDSIEASLALLNYDFNNQ